MSRKVGASHEAAKTQGGVELGCMGLDVNPNLGLGAIHKG